MRIFGREPALWLALIAAAIKLAAAFLVDLTGDQQAVLNAVAAAAVGLIVAGVTRDGVSAAILGLAQALLALTIGFGLDVTAENQAVIMAFVAAAVGMFERTQVTAPARPPA